MSSAEQSRSLGPNSTIQMAGVAFLIGAVVSCVWWASGITADVRNLQRGERLQIEKVDKIDRLEMEIGSMKRDVTEIKRLMDVHIETQNRAKP